MYLTDEEYHTDIWYCSFVGHCRLKRSGDSRLEILSPPQQGSFSHWDQGFILGVKVGGGGDNGSRA